MARPTRFLSRFDRDAEFVVLRPVTVEARDLRPGEPFDKTLVTTRRLRQLYDQRRVAMLPPAPAPVVPPPAAPGRAARRRR